MVYSLEIVGGPYDGADGLSWNVEAAEAAGHDGEPPRHIFVATCTGKPVYCEGRKKSHPHYWYWLESEDPPVRAVGYGLMEVEEDAEDFPRARYGFGHVSWLDSAVSSVSVTA